MNALTKIAALAALLMGVASVAPADSTLTVGSKAPSLKVARWVKGKPVKAFESGKVYVVEFWATWCGPCKESIPHLTELAKKYEGKAVFTGVSVWEKNAPLGKHANYGEKVDTFVKEWGDKMAYNVAWDGDEGVMADTWMKAAGQNGIPAAFVVDQTGTVVWIGHPMSNLDEVVGQVIEGTFDVKAEADRQEKAKAEQAKAMAKVTPFMGMLREKKFQEAVAEMDKLFANEPTMELPYGTLKLNALYQFDASKANAYAAKLAEGAYSQVMNSLNSVAWMMIDDKTLAKGADIKLAIRIAEKGASLAKDGDPMVAYMLDTLAFCYFKDGQVAKAVSTQEKALKVAKSVEGFDPDTLKEISDRLELFKKKG